ncbi:hypothetical protein LSH36_20g09029 [Paralvinella palmiformis]|uniref:Phosphoinositide phospholipase C n=1 Tax=Paralvinella palmiformis TaxID=53620 RepID=A0AAD9KCG3_9ANNE|nr:hypothetical protein LSH36_20g09029 [Paralvinella palmiformis]
MSLRYWSHKITFRRNNYVKIPLTDIREVREGPNTDLFSKAEKHFKLEPSLCFSLIHGEKYETLDLVADDELTCKSWVIALRHLLKILSQTDLVTQQKVWMRQLFKKADKDHNEQLTLKEILNLLKHLNIAVSYESAKQAFEEQQNNTPISIREELYNCGGQYLDREELSEFLLMEQETHEPCPVLTQKNLMSIDVAQQTVMAQIMKKVFKEKLLLTPYPDSLKDLPSPESLKGRIIIKAKKRPPDVSSEQSFSSDSSEDSDQDSGQGVFWSFFNFSRDDAAPTKNPNGDGDEVDAIPTLAGSSQECTETDGSRSKDGQHLMDESFPIETHKNTAVDELVEDKNISLTEVDDERRCYHHDPEAVCNSVSRKSAAGDEKTDDASLCVKGKKLSATVLKDAEEGEVTDEDEAAEMPDNEISKIKKKNNCKQMSSFGESKAIYLSGNQPDDYIKHNMWQLSRVYPSGMRTDSSNYDPVPLWNVGCQLVALNFQTNDESMQINRGKFEDNAGTFKFGGPYDLRLHRQLILKIIRGYQLPKKPGDKARSILDPYVKVDIYGYPDDTKTFRTNYVKNNGFDPKWDETFTTTVKVPDLAILRFQVKDYQDYSSDVTVAQYALPFNSVQQGFRTVHLKSRYGEAIRGATLLIHVSIEVVST